MLKYLLKMMDIWQLFEKIQFWPQTGAYWAEKDSLCHPQHRHHGRCYQHRTHQCLWIIWHQITVAPAPVVPADLWDAHREGCEEDCAPADALGPSDGGRWQPQGQRSGFSTSVLRSWLRWSLPTCKLPPWDDRTLFRVMTSLETFVHLQHNWSNHNLHSLLRIIFLQPLFFDPLLHLGRGILKLFVFVVWNFHLPQNLPPRIIHLRTNHLRFDWFS
jgi:hypothetical protein